MRSALLGLTASLVALPLAAQAQVTRLSQSSVSLTATFSRSSEPSDPKIANGRSTVTTTFDRVTLRNADILTYMLENGQLPEGQTSIKGWTLVAVWADWESSENSSYRFFARKTIDGVATVIAVPDSLLRLALLDPYVRKNVRVENGAAVSGSDLYKAVAALSIGAVTTAEEDDRETAAGQALGVIFGPGRYARPSGSTGSIYLPGATSFTGYGVSDADVIVARLRLSASRAVASTPFSSFIDTAAGNNSTGPDSTAMTEILENTSSSLTVTGSGTLTLGSSDSAPEPTTIINGELSSPAGIAATVSFAQ